MRENSKAIKGQLRQEGSVKLDILDISKTNSCSKGVEEGVENVDDGLAWSIASLLEKDR